MSKVGYTEMSLGKALQYEHRIKVNDFVRVLKQKGEIRTNLLEVFPDLKVEFVIRMLAENCTVNDVQYQYTITNVGIYNKKNQLDWSSIRNPETCFSSLRSSLLSVPFPPLSPRL